MPGRAEAVFWVAEGVLRRARRPHQRRRGSGRGQNLALLPRRGPHGGISRSGHSRGLFPTPSLPPDQSFATTPRPLRVHFSGGRPLGPGAAAALGGPEAWSAAAGSGCSGRGPQVRTARIDRLARHKGGGAGGRASTAAQAHAGRWVSLEKAGWPAFEPRRLSPPPRGVIYRRE